MTWGKDIDAREEGKRGSPHAVVSPVIYFAVHRYFQERLNIKCNMWHMYLITMASSAAV